MALHLVSTTQLHHHPPAPTPQIITPQRTSNWLLAAAKLRPSFWPRWVHLVLPAQHDKASWPHGSLLQKRVAGAFLAALCSGASLHPDSFVILGSGFKKRELDVSFIGGGGGGGFAFPGHMPSRRVFNGDWEFSSPQEPTIQWTDSTKAVEWPSPRGNPLETLVMASERIESPRNMQGILSRETTTSYSSPSDNQIYCFCPLACDS